MITRFVHEKMGLARYKILDDKTYFGEIPKMRGVWASATKLEDCREELREVLEDWIVVKLKSGEKISGLAFPKSKSKKFEYA